MPFRVCLQCTFCCNKMLLLPNPSGIEANISGQEVLLHPSAGVILTTSKILGSNCMDGELMLLPSTNGYSERILPHSLEMLSRPVCVMPPPINTLISAWLQSYAVARTQEVGSVVGEVLRQIIGSYRTKVVGGLRLFMRFTQHIVSALAKPDNSLTPVEAAALGFKTIISPVLPSATVPAVQSVLDLLLPEMDEPIAEAERLTDSERNTQEAVICQLGLERFEKQVEATSSIMRAVSEWGCIIVVGPPRSGKSTVISIATHFLHYQQQLLNRSSDNIEHILSTAHRSSITSQDLEQCSPLQSQDNTASSLSRPDIIRNIGAEDEIQVLQTDWATSDKFLFTVRPHSYCQSRFYGTAERDGLFPCLLRCLSHRSSHSYVVLEGYNCAQCLLRMRDLPGTMILESLNSLQLQSNITFIIEACSVEEIPQWVVGRSAIVQIDGDSLSTSSLLPRSDLVPLTPASDRQSQTSATPRTVSKPNTPVQDDKEQVSQTKIREYLFHRLLQPLLEMMEDGLILHAISVVDVLQQVSLLASEEDGSACDSEISSSVAPSGKLSLGGQKVKTENIVQAALQISRASVILPLLPKLNESLRKCLKKIENDNVLSSSDKEVIQNLNDCTGSVFDQMWNSKLASWCPWLSGEDENMEIIKLSGIGYSSVATKNSRRLLWFIEKMMKAEKSVVVVGGPGTGKTTATLQALSQLRTWVTVKVNINCETTAQEIEDVILSHLKQISFDTVAPAQPTVFCVDDLGTLPGNSPALNYLQGLIQHRGLYSNSEQSRWMNLTNVYIIGICSYYNNKWAYVEGLPKFWGWIVYNMDSQESEALSYVCSALKPIASLQSQILTTMTSMTESVAMKLTTLCALRKEPFMPANRQIIVWRIASALKRICNAAPTSLDIDGKLLLNVWLHAVTAEVLFSVYSEKRKEKAWREIQCCMHGEGCDVYGTIPASPLIPVWPSMRANDSTILPKYLTFDNAAKEIEKTLEAIGVTESIKCHRGLGTGIAVVVDALHSLVVPESTHTAPFLLLLGPPTRDKNTVLSFAASYMGFEVLSGDTEEDILNIIEKESKTEEETKDKSNIVSLISVPAAFLRNREVAVSLVRLVVELKHTPMHQMTHSPNQSRLFHSSARSETR
ncbi:hypothetical protein SK128_021632, partial [Halocaridina rubra]